MVAGSQSSFIGRLSTRLFLYIFALVLIPTVVVSVLAVRAEYSGARNSAHRELDAVLTVNEQRVNTWLRTNENSIAREANQFTADTEATITNEVLAEIATSLALQNNSEIIRVVYVNIDGTIASSSDQAVVGVDVSGEPWYLTTLASATEEMTNIQATAGPYVDPINGVRSLYFSSAIFDGSNAVGVLNAQVDLNSLTAQITPDFAALGQTGELMLVGPSRQYIVHPNAALIGETARGDIVATALSGRASEPSEWSDYRAETVLGSYGYIEQIDSALIVKRDVDEVFQSAQQMTTLLIVVAVALGTLALVLGWVFSRRIFTPFEQVSEMIEDLSQAAVSSRLPTFGAIEVDRIAEPLNTLAQNLEQEVRTREQVQNESAQRLRITTELGRLIASETDLDKLLNTTVNLICERLGYNHAQVFLIDDLRQYAVLQASTGEIGQSLIERRHKLAVGSQSVIGRVSESLEPVLARHTDNTAIQSRNELLPNTRAELAVPLRLGNETIGVLDIQSDEEDAFDEQTSVVLQIIADQLAVAIQNAQLFQEKEGLLSASLQLTQMLTKDNWDSFAEDRVARDAIGYMYDLTRTVPLDTSAEVGATNGDGHTNGSPNKELNLPIALRGEVIGELAAALPEDRELTGDDMQLVQDVLNRVALALDNARLFEQTQSSLMETNRVYEASQKISEADTINELANRVINTIQSEATDRILFYSPENIDEKSTRQQADLIGYYQSPQIETSYEPPEIVFTGGFPLMQVSQAGMENLILNTPEDTSEEERWHMEQTGTLSMVTLPLVAGRRVLAWLIIQNTRRRYAYTEVDVRFFRAVAEQAATTLDNLRLFEQTTIRARRLQATNQVTRAASSVLSLDILLPLIVDQISQAFDYYHVQIFLVDEMGEWANLEASTGEVGQEMLRRKWRLGVGSDSVIGQTTLRGEPIIARDTEDADVVHRPNELLPETRAEMAIPLKTGDRIIGALDVQSKAINAFDDEALSILQSLADQISVTLENAQLFREIQERVTTLTTINLVSTAVSRADTKEELFEVITEHLFTRTFATKYGFLGLLNEEGLLELPIFIENGVRKPSPEPRPLGDGPTRYVIENQTFLFLNEDAEERAQEMGVTVQGQLPKSMLMVPLTIGQEVIGVLSVQDMERENAYKYSERNQLVTLAPYIAVKLRNADLLDEAEVRASELGFLFRVTQAAVAADEIDEALVSVAQLLQAEIDGAQTAEIFLLDRHSDELRLQASVGPEGTTTGRSLLMSNAALPTMVASTRISMVVDDAREEFGIDSEGITTRAAVLVPLITADNLVGVLTVQSSLPNQFDENDRQLLETASNTLTAIIQNARLLEEIREANAQLTELDNLKSQFLANMSHELRTPLNSIIGFSKVLLKGIDGELNEIQRQDLMTINESGTHLLGLINDILDMSKIESGKMEIHPEYIDLQPIFDGVIATGKGLLKDKPVHLHKEVQADLPKVYGDQTRIRQVLLNLVSNAAKFTNEGEIMLRSRRISADRELGIPASVQISVTDSGIGIPEKDWPKLFEEFRQVDGSTTRQAGGTGLGLPISKRFVEMHGGQMWLESEENMGSTFFFTIPLHPIVEEGAEAEVLIRSENLDDGQPVILAVDDQQGVLDLYKRYLEKAGYGLVGLSNANNIFDYINDLSPQAILLDINLPGKDGWQVLSELRDSKEARRIPVIICSIDDDLRRGLDLGANGYLTKPIIENDLLLALDEATSAAIDDVRNVLIVDADREYGQAISQVLEETGKYQSRVVSQGFEALQVTQEANIDVMVIDVDLSDMDGYGLLMAMRSHEDTKHIPVVVITARELSTDELMRLDDISALYIDKRQYQDADLLDSLSMVFKRGVSGD